MEQDIPYGADTRYYDGLVCTYVARNENVAVLDYSPGDGTGLPIQVVTGGELRAASQVSNFGITAFCVLYPIEFLIVLIIYLKKREQ